MVAYLPTLPRGHVGISGGGDDGGGGDGDGDGDGPPR